MKFTKYEDIEYPAFVAAAIAKPGEIIPWYATFLTSTKPTQKDIEWALKEIKRFENEK